MPVVTVLLPRLPSAEAETGLIVGSRKRLLLVMSGQAILSNGAFPLLLADKCSWNAVLVACRNAAADKESDRLYVELTGTF